MTTPAGKARPRFGLLRLIAVYKLGKVLLLLGAAYGVLRLRDASFIARLEQDVVRHALAWFSGLSTSRVEAIGAVTLSYAAIFAIEGVGLWLRRRWAEWLTTIVTASLVPLEVWEIVHRPTAGKAAVLVVNIAIVWYLILQLRSSRHFPAA